MTSSIGTSARSSLRHLAARDPVVMVVDDQETNVRLVGTVLTQAGFEVVPAMSGEQALQRAAASPPDLVLLDMMMPGMNGIDVMIALRERPETAHIPAIFLTAAHEREQLVRAFEAGAVDYVTKPFVAEELLARVRTHLELKLVRDHLKRVAQEREELAAVVAHDLKNPLSSIHFSAQLLLRDEAGARGPADLARVILESTESALAFIQRYLERRAEGELARTMAPVRVQLAAQIQQAVRRFAVQANAKDVTLSTELAEVPEAFADPGVLAQVLDNLLSNAIKFSPPGSEVTLTLGEGSPGRVRTMVLDRGPGVNSHDQRRLFQRFVRLAARPTGGESSSGLGLALAKQDIEHMQGELWYEDRRGGGSVFAFELPVAPPAT